MIDRDFETWARGRALDEVTTEAARVSDVSGLALGVLVTFVDGGPPGFDLVPLYRAKDGE